MSNQHRLLVFFITLILLLVGALVAHAQSSAVAPGRTLSLASAATSDQPGSVLIFSYYASGRNTVGIEDTEISFTNTHHEETVGLRLYVVNAQTHAINHKDFCLPPNQTNRLMASSLSAGASGYILASAIDAAGRPVGANYLLGGANFKFKSGQTVHLPAIAVPALFFGTFPGSTRGGRAYLQFDGNQYGTLPHAVAAGDIPSPADGSSALLILNRIGGDFLLGTASTLGKVEGTVFDDAGRGFSFAEQENSPQLVRTISNDFPQPGVPLSQLIPSGRSGRMRMWSANSAGLMGALLSFNPKTGQPSGARLLQRLTQTSGSLLILLTPANCALPPATPKADPALTLTTSATSIAPGGQASYNINVTNHGPDDDEVIVTSELAGASTFLSCAVAGGASCLEDGKTFRFAIVQLKKGQSATIAVVIKADANAAVGSDISLRSSARPASAEDPIQNNNAAYSSLRVRNAPASAAH